jgi:hypothetical protein
MKNKYWWILGVATITAVAFLIPDRTGEIWMSVVSAMAVVGVFYLGLVVYIFKKGESTADKIVGISVISLLAALIIFNGIIQYKGAILQHKTLTEIRTVIDKGIILAYTQEPLLKTLRTYHNQTDNQDLSLQEIFKERYGNNIQRDSEPIRFIPDEQKDNREESPFIYYKENEESDTVMLIGQSLIVNGSNSTFSNYNGQKGFLQYKTTLTKDGVDYVREN